jgi:hypothetical protein
MQTVRQALKNDVDESGQGMQGASLLFYYLFDDWRAVFFTVAMYKQRLSELVSFENALDTSTMLTTIAGNNLRRYCEYF